MKRGIRLVSVFAAVVMLCVARLQTFAYEAENGYRLYAGNTGDVLTDGEYYVNVDLWKFSENSASMGNPALKDLCADDASDAETSGKQMRLTVSGEKAYLDIEFQPMTFLERTGRLLEMVRMLDIVRDEEGAVLSFTEAYPEVIGESDETDEFGPPSGRKYPQLLRFDVSDAYAGRLKYIPVRVHVPVMGSISADAAEQSARLQFDWSTLRPIPAKTDPAGTDRNPTDADPDPVHTDPDPVPIDPDPDDPLASPEGALDVRGTSVSADRSGAETGGRAAAGEGSQDNTDRSGAETGGGVTAGEGALAANPAPTRDGEYRVDFDLWKYNENAASMGNPALTDADPGRAGKQAKLVIENDRAYLYIGFTNMTFMGRTGRLLEIVEMTNITKDEYGAITSFTPVYPTVVETTDETDSFGPPAGQKYPQTVRFDVTQYLNSGTQYIPAQVNVPVMGSISADSAKQPARIKLNWSTLTLVAAAAGNPSLPGTTVHVPQTNSGESGADTNNATTNTNTNTGTGTNTGTNNNNTNTGNTQTANAAGFYTVPVRLWHASMDKASMGDDALEDTAYVRVQNGVATMRITSKEMTVSGITAHLYSFQIDNGGYRYADLIRSDHDRWVFEFTLPNDSSTYYNVKVDPKVEVMGTDPVSARLRVDWSGKKAVTESAWNALAGTVSESEKKEASGKTTDTSNTANTAGTKNPASENDAGTSNRTSVKDTSAGVLGASRGEGGSVLAANRKSNANDMPVTGARGERTVTAAAYLLAMFEILCLIIAVSTWHFLEEGDHT